MTQPSLQQIRAFRLRAHHLDRAYCKQTIRGAVVSLWETPGEKQRLYDMAKGYAAFRQQKLLGVEL